MKKIGLEFKVGLFVIMSVAILIGLVLKAGDHHLRASYTVRLIFNFVNGIDSGSPVRLAGVNVGEVKKIQVVRNPQGETQVEVTAWIMQGVYIEEDAKARVDSLGLLGEKYIEIVPGTSGQKTLSDSGTLVGRPSAGVDDIVESGKRLVGKMEIMVDNLNEVVADPGFKTSVKNTFSNADTLTKSFIETSDDIRDAAKSAKIVLGRLRDGEGSIGRLLKDDKIAKDLEAFVADIKAHPWKLLKRD